MMWSHEVTQLRHDLRNGPSHVFGNHTNCSKDFCTFQQNPSVFDNESSSSAKVYMGLLVSHWIGFHPLGEIICNDENILELPQSIYCGKGCLFLRAIIQLDLPIATSKVQG